MMRLKLRHGFKENFNMKKWTIFLKAKQEVIGQQDGEDVMGYKLGPTNYIVQLHQVVNILTVGSYHCILHMTDSSSIANLVKDWPEFMGFGYTDMVMRIAQGLSQVTLSDIEYLTGAHWFTGGEWHFGNVKDWKAAGSPTTVWFGKYRDVMGLSLE